MSTYIYVYPNFESTGKSSSARCRLTLSQLAIYILNIYTHTNFESTGNNSSSARCRRCRRPHRLCQCQARGCLQPFAHIPPQRRTRHGATSPCSVRHILGKQKKWIKNQKPLAHTQPQRRTRHGATSPCGLRHILEKKQSTSLVKRHRQCTSELGFFF